MNRRVRSSVLLSIVALMVGGCTFLPAPPDAPAEVDGVRVLTVTQAIAAREAGASGPIAIGGWFSAAPAHSCPAPIGRDGVFREPNPLELYCHEGDWALAENPEAIVDVTITTVGGSTSMEVRGRTMTGAWIQPVLAGGADVLWTGPEPWQPKQVVLVGHFRDAGAATCLPELRQACLERLVVEKVAWRR